MWLYILGIAPVYIYRQFSVYNTFPRNIGKLGHHLYETTIAVYSKLPPSPPFLYMLSTIRTIFTIEDRPIQCVEFNDNIHLL
jgi:hypothetical protein